MTRSWCSRDTPFIVPNLCSYCSSTQYNTIEPLLCVNLEVTYHEYVILSSILFYKFTTANYQSITTVWGLRLTKVMFCYHVIICVSICLLTWIYT